ncbi:MAG: hypothetical protein ACTSUE_13300 [Promethearchaeota archaeon]
MGETVVKQYRCGVCNIMHKVEIPADLAKGKDRYPFAHVFLHKIEQSDDVEEIGLDVLTTLHLDANLAVRFVEVKKLSASDIMSKDDSMSIVTQLMAEIARMQEAHADLEKKYKALLSENARLKEQ